MNWLITQYWYLITQNSNHNVCIDENFFFLNVQINHKNMHTKSTYVHGVNALNKLRNTLGQPQVANSL